MAEHDVQLMSTSLNKLSLDRKEMSGAEGNSTDAGSKMHSMDEGESDITDSQCMKTAPKVVAKKEEEDEEGMPPGFKWKTDELRTFWKNAMPKYNCYKLDGLHPKALCSKICNDVLRTNINLNSSSSNPNDRMLCFEVLAQMEQKFMDAKVIEKPVRKPGGTAAQLQYKRVTFEEWNSFADHLGSLSLETWARGCVEDSIRILSQHRQKVRQQQQAQASS